MVPPPRGKMVLDSSQFRFPAGVRYHDGPTHLYDDIAAFMWDDSNSNP